MSEFTAEDFAQANLATKGKFGVARRTDPHFARQWRAYGSRQGYFSDEELAADGWTPVVESRITDHTLRHVEERAERERQRLVAHIGSVEAAVRDRNRTIAGLRHDLEVAQKELANLREENYRLDAEADGAISLDGLEAAWEAAEQASECRKGDVLIMQDPAEGYSVWRTGDADYLSSGTRILSRAPREPWQDLADALRGTVWERLSGDVDGLAAAVHAAGWRKGGEES